MFVFVFFNESSQCWIPFPFLVMLVCYCILFLPIPCSILKSFALATWSSHWKNLRWKSRRPPSETATQALDEELELGFSTKYFIVFLLSFFSYKVVWIPTQLSWVEDPGIDDPGSGDTGQGIPDLMLLYCMFLLYINGPCYWMVLSLPCWFVQTTWLAHDGGQSLVLPCKLFPMRLLQQQDVGMEVPPISSWKNAMLGGLARSDIFDFIMIYYIFSHCTRHLNPLRLCAARGRRRDWLNSSCLEKDATQSESWDVRLQLRFSWKIRKYIHAEYPAILIQHDFQMFFLSANMLQAVNSTGPTRSPVNVLDGLRKRKIRFNDNWVLILGICWKGRWRACSEM